MERDEELKRAKAAFDDSLYIEDDAAYPEFDEDFDCEVVFPIEADIFVSNLLPEEQATVPKKRRKKPTPAEVLSFFLLFVERLGAETRKAVSAFFSKFGFVFAFPFVFLFSKLKGVLSSIGASLLSAPKGLSAELKSIRLELSAITSTAKKRENISLLKALSKYFLLSFTRHGRLWKGIFNTVFPVAACVLVLFVFSEKSDGVFALDVSYNGTHIGYVENEDTYEEAKALAIEMLPADLEGVEQSSLSFEPTYTLKHVSVGELSNSSMICEKLLSASGASLTRACGIYIDGEFLCAVKNESDAVSVFNAILAPSKKNADEGTLVAFVEEISYVQGLYPDNDATVWDSLKLKRVLNEPKSSPEYHTVKKGETALSIAKKNSLSLSRLKALNPGTDFSKKLKRGTELLVKAQTDYVRTKVMKTRSTTSFVPFERVTRESSSMLKGTKKVTQTGKNGERVTTSLVTYINGKETYSTVLSVKQTKDPVNEITLVGTKSPYSYYYGSYYGGSYGYSGFIWPTRGAYSISSGYGYRSASISGWGYHGGIDIIRGGGSSAGTPVIAAASGTVITAYAGSTGYGNTVLIDHGNGYQTRYGHMLWGSICVYPGQRVYQGQQIGQIGSTGNSTGPHLHFEIIKNGSKVNPLPYIS